MTTVVSFDGADVLDFHTTRAGLRRTLRFKDSDGNPISLTGYVFTGEVYSGHIDRSPVIATMSLIVSVTTPSEVALTLDTSQMGGTYCYRIFSTDTQGRIRPWLKGDLFVARR